MIDEGEKKKFQNACEQVIARGRAEMGIGSLGEKYMHLILKNFICENTDCHEVGQGRYFADVLVEDTVYEIQTGGYYPLKKKLQYYLSESEKRVVIVTPVVRRKRLIWVDPEDGSVTEGRRATVPHAWIKILREMYWLCGELDFDRVSFWFPVVSVDEYRKRDGFGKDKKIKATKIEKIPRELLDIEEVTCAEDVARLFLPAELPERFTAAEFSRRTGARRLTLSSCIHALENLRVIEKDGKIGSAAAYKITC